MNLDLRQWLLDFHISRMSPAVGLLGMRNPEKTWSKLQEGYVVINQGVILRNREGETISRIAAIKCDSGDIIRHYIIDDSGDEPKAVLTGSPLMILRDGTDVIKYYYCK